MTGSSVNRVNFMARKAFNVTNQNSGWVARWRLWLRMAVGECF